MNNKYKNGIIIGCLLLIIFSITSFIGCGASKINTSGKIVPPDNKRVPIEGTYKVMDFKAIDDVHKKDIGNWIGKKAEFNNKIASLGEDKCANPNYKIKKVDAEDYFLYVYKVPINLIDIEKKQLEVVSITSQESFFYEIIKLSKDKIMIYVDGGFIYLDKISDKTKNKVLKSKEIEEKQEEIIRKEPTSSGILLGLKYEKENDEENLKTQEYRTLWISTDNGKLNNIIESKDLILPRNKGFWRVGINSECYKKELYAYPLYADANLKEKKEIKLENCHVEELKKEKNTTNNVKDNEKNKYESIQYIGNDYICLEKDILKKETNKYMYNVYTIDNLLQNKEIKISDLIGEEGTKIYNKDANSKILSSLHNKQIKDKIKINETNFTIKRKNGRWIFVGRLDLTELDEEERKDNKEYIDFNINSIPPKNIVAFDNLSVPWSEIKSTRPDAVDAYTSPNKEFAIIIGYTNMYIYSIKNSKLNVLIEKLKIKPEEKVVMSEWATGSYVKRWDKSFKENQNK